MGRVKVPFIKPEITANEIPKYIDWLSIITIP
jgi:hypothetical protein